jgi:Fur family transcriptional regulator, stress-responsive regulator
VLIDRLRETDWRLTPQRRAIAEALAGEHVHLTAEEVLAAARRAVPEVSLATVYNTLGELVAMGQLAEVRITGSPSVRYDPNVGTVHHHLVCDGCGLIYDVHPTGVEALALPRHERYGMKVRTVQVTFVGTCSNCAETRVQP